MKIPARLRNSKLYTESEFLALKGASNRQERLLAAVLDNRTDFLSDIDFRYLQLLKRAWNVAVNELSPQLREQKIKLLLDHPARPRVRQVMRDMSQIWGNINDSNREMERRIYIHRISKHINRLERNYPDSAVIGTLYKLLKEVQGLDYNENTIPWEELELHPPVYTTDIKAIPEQPETDTAYEIIE